MVSVTRTLGPLHLEDLEPHRFEDLIRQLLYDFRPWRQLESTGRAGSDDGFDARGWEKTQTALEGVAQDGEGVDEGERFAPSDEPDRQWLIQCKREKAIGPAKLSTYLSEISTKDSGQLYGLVFAAACNFSKAARDAFSSAAISLGISERYLWGKGEIEDMLFQPKNDHLLFAYFGVSLTTRRRTVASKVRGRLAVKRKAERLLREYSVALIKDAEDERYPYLDPSERDDTLAARTKRGRWLPMRFERSMHLGLQFEFLKRYAFLADDKKRWDSCRNYNDAEPGWHENPWAKHEEQEEARRKAVTRWLTIPDTNRAMLVVTGILSWDDIIDIDERGDDVFQGPQIYTAAWKGLDPFKWTQASLQVGAGVDTTEVECVLENRTSLFWDLEPKP